MSYHRLPQCTPPAELIGFRWSGLARDTDGSPEGTDPKGLDGEAATAGAEGIAQNSSAELYFSKGGVKDHG